MLMQMGRWLDIEKAMPIFARYIKRFRRFIIKTIISSTEQLKRDIKKMCDLKQRPVDFGIRVRNDFYNGLRITAG